MGDHGAWYPTSRHVVAIWVVWSLVILFVVAVLTGSLSAQNPSPVQMYRDRIQLLIEGHTELPTADLGSH